VEVLLAIKKVADGGTMAGSTLTKKKVVEVNTMLDVSVC
jgi:hypothetical protein